MKLIITLQLLAGIFSERLRVSPGNKDDFSSFSTVAAVPVSPKADSGDRHWRQTQQFEQYQLWEPKDISDTLLKWKTHYADLIRVTTSQEAFGLDRAGDENDCPHDEGRGCLNYFFVMQDFVAHPEGSESSNRLPEVMWSGEVHGDEQVGPTAVLEASQLLMDAALCESFPRVALRGTEDWQKEVTNAKECREDLQNRFGITDSERQWLARLITTRRIVVIPTANALGYYRKVRTEGYVDPNRDFPYDLTDPKSCMQTIAARTLNEVFREHMFQLAFTFHGGMEVIGYEWGAPHWNDYKSPDDTAQHDIAATYSHFGGGWSSSKPYEYGDMNTMVYGVNGGMEDWAYAGSWDPDRVVQCQPETFGGYASNKTSYGPSTLRTFNMLVESSNHKIPSAQSLGTSQDLLRFDSAGTGYVSRNIRLSLMSAELVEPYVFIQEVNELLLSDDLVPLMERAGGRCQDTKSVSVPANSRKVVLQWVVGGSLAVDQTQIWYAKWSDVPTDELECLKQPSMESIKKYMKVSTPISATTGSGRFKPGDSHAPFSASIDISSGFAVGDQLVVVASARVDQNWIQATDGAKPKLAPQSHVVNVRTNSSWYHESDGKIIQGRLDWFSAPLTIVLRDDDTSGEPVAIELSDRFSSSPSGSGGEGTTTPDATTTGNSSKASEQPVEKVGKSLGTIVLVAVVLVVVVVIGQIYLQYRMRQAQRTRVREFIADQSAPTPGLRHKKNGDSRKGYTDLDASELEMGQFS